MTEQNPYQSPPHVKIPSSRLKKIEALVVKYFLQCRKRPPTWFFLWRRFFPHIGIQILILTGVVLVASIVVSTTYLVYIGVLAVGIIIGSSARDLGFCQRIALQWPVLEQLLDWEKIEQKHEEHSP